MNRAFLLSAIALLSFANAEVVRSRGLESVETHDVAERNLETDVIIVGGKKTGYDYDGGYGGKKGGYDFDGYGGKKGGCGGKGGGKKGGYDEFDGYGGKKGGYPCPTPAPVPAPVPAPTPEPIPAPTPAPIPPCNPCGGDMTITNPSGIVDFFGEDMTCEELENEGAASLITPATCEVLPSMVRDTCCPPPCNPCGGDMDITRPGAVVDVYGEEMTCSELASAGEMSMIPVDTCDALPDMVSDICCPIPCGKGGKGGKKGGYGGKKGGSCGKKGGYGGKKGGYGYGYGKGGKGGKKGGYAVYSGKKSGYSAAYSSGYAVYSGKKGGYYSGYSSGYTGYDVDDCCDCGYIRSGKKGGLVYDCDCSSCDSSSSEDHGDDDDDDDDNDDDDDDDDGDDDDDDDDDGDDDDDDDDDGDDDDDDDGKNYRYYYGKKGHH